MSLQSKDKITVFIGSGEASLLERKTFIHTIKKHTSRNLDIRVFNGTHNTIESHESTQVAPLELDLKYQNITEFSLYRFLIPELCNYEGRAIYVDSDMLCLHDIGNLFDSDMNGCDFLAKKEAYNGESTWGLSVMLIDCEKSKFELKRVFDEISKGLYSYTDFSQMTPKFLSFHPYSIGSIDPNWNVFDYYDGNTKLIHYTNLYTQPWKYRHHPYGDLWFSFFKEAMENNLISENDIHLSKVRSSARRDILKGNSPYLPIDKLLRIASKIKRFLFKK